MKTVFSQFLSKTFTGHRGPVTCAAPIPGQPRLITSGYDSAVGLFDLAKGEVTCLGYHRHLANRVVVNSTGTRAASCSSDYRVAIWDLINDRLERVLLGHADDVEDFAFMDDNRGASVSRDCRLMIWDLTSGAIVRIIEEHQKDVLSVSYHDGKLITSGDDMTMCVWNADSGERLRKWGPFETEVDTCDVDPIHNRAVLGCDDGRIRVFDLESGAMLADIEAHASAIKKVAVSPANGDILSAAYDQKILIWDGRDFSLKKSLVRCPTAWERAFNWSADGQQVVTGTFDGTVVAWNTSEGTIVGEYGEKGVGTPCLNEVSAAGSGHIAAVSDSGHLHVGRLTGGEARWSVPVAPASGRVLMNATRFDQKRGRILCGSHDQKLHIYAWDGVVARPEGELMLGEGPINCIRVACQRGYEGEAFVACYSGAVVRVGLAGEIALAIRLNEGAVKAVDLHPRHPIGVSCSADGGLLSWEFDGTLLNRFPGHLAIVDDVSLDPTGTLLASVSRDFTLKVFELASGRLRHSFSLGRRSPKAVLFYDEQTVLVTNYWGELIRADLNCGHVVRATIADNGLSGIDRLGDEVALSCYDGSVYLINVGDLSVRAQLDNMRQKVARPFAG